MKTAFNFHDFGRLSPKRGQTPLATSRLALKWLGKNRRHYATQ